jgi:hypothetical protein
MDFSVETILDTIKYTDVPSLKEIKKEREDKLYDFYKKFLDIPKNVTNLDNAKKILENYRYISYEDIKKGDIIKYVWDKYFYDIEIRGGGCVVKKNKGLCLLRTSNLSWAKSKLFFKRINNDEMSKIVLMDIIDNEKID